MCYCLNERIVIVITEFFYSALTIVWFLYPIMLCVLFRKILTDVI